MTDRLGEALARFPSDELPDDPTTADHDAYEVVAAAARSWHALTNPTDELVERVAVEIWVASGPTPSQRDYDQWKITGGKDRWRAMAKAAVDALSVTPTPEKTG